MGAAAFAVWFWQMANYTDATMDSRPLRQVMGGSCAVCRQVARSIDRGRRSGERQIGGVFSAMNPHAVGRLDGKRATYQVTLALHATRLRVQRPGRKDTIAKALSLSEQMTLVPVASGWKVAEFFKAGETPDFG